MNHRSAVRDTCAYLALVTGGSIAVALALSRSTAAPRSRRSSRLLSC